MLNKERTKKLSNILRCHEVFTSQNSNCNETKKFDFEVGLAV